MPRTLFAVLLAIAPIVAAQTHSDEITVNVVEVPVYVERWGRAVEGLTKDDFELLVDGRPQRIDYFDVIGQPRRGEAASDVAGAPPLHRRRLFMLLFDVLALSHHGARRAQEQALAFVDAAGPGDAFAVATTAAHGVRVIVPFTGDRVGLRRAIRTLRPSAARDAFGLATLEAERESWHRAQGVVRAVSDPSRSPFDGDVLNAIERRNAVYELGRTNAFARHLGRLADRLAPLSGIKQVILFSERGSITTFELAAEAEAMHRKFLAASVVLNVVDPGGLNAPWGVGLSTPQVGPSDVLYLLSRQTGGTVTLSLQQLRAMESVSYVLGFHPSVKREGRKSIHLRLRDAPFGTTVRHRSSYAAASSAVADHGLLLADVLLNDIPQHGLTTHLAATAQAGAAKLAVSIPGPELLALGRETRFDAYLYLFDERGAVAEWVHLRVDLDLDEGRDVLAAQPYTIERTFKLAPGRYTAKVLVRVARAEVRGFARAELVIPE